MVSRLTQKAMGRVVLRKFAPKPPVPLGTRQVVQYVRSAFWYKLHVD